MKKQGIIELIIGIVGLAILLIFQNIWSYIPLILYGLVSAVMIRKTVFDLTDEEKICMKKRNILSITLLPIFLIICYFASNETISNDLLWVLLAIYLFLAAHGIVFIAPVNAFGNERK